MLDKDFLYPTFHIIHDDDRLAKKCAACPAWCQNGRANPCAGRGDPQGKTRLFNIARGRVVPQQSAGP